LQSAIYYHLPWDNTAMLESLLELRVFIQVVDAQSFTGASDVLGTSTNAVSRQVARLEKRLRVRLLTRTTRRVSPTEEGRRLYDHAVRLLRSAEEAEAAVRRASQRLDGTVRVAVRTTTLQSGFVGDLVALLKANPELSVQLIVSDAEIDLASKGIDLALRVGELASSSYRRVSLGQVLFVLAATPGYVKERGLPLTPADLSAHECVRPLFKRPQTLWRLSGPDGVSVEVPVAGHFESADLRAQSDAIYGGLGIGFRPSGEVEAAVEAGTLVRILPQWTLPPLVVSALLSPQRSQNLRVDAVLSILKTAIRRLGDSERPADHRGPR
jgi:DNA-binding transcriptional LysR family regulator